jgi:3-methyladenine DNA glycosylase AlkD
MELVHELWAQPQREYQYVAIDLLSRHWKRFSLEHIDELLLLVTQRSWWDSVDGLAGVIGDILRAACKHSKNAQNKMDVALLSEDFWVRRVAMLHQLGWRAETDVARLFDYARKLSPDKNFFIRKAIGWSLRDYARHEPNQVLRFLNEAGTRISPLSKREATKHLQAT